MIENAVLLSPADYRDAVATAVKAAAAYYTDGSTTLGDDEYDALVRAIEAYEDARPGEALPDSPTGKVAGGAATGDVPHTVPMLSLDNVFSGEELAEWAAGLERRLGRPAAGFCVEPKLDGLAVAARYTAGRLRRLLTRGNGQAGEDITHAADAILGLPQLLTEPLDIEIRGEVLFTHDQFDQANQARTAHGAAPSPTRATRSPAPCGPRTAPTGSSRPSSATTPSACPPTSTTPCCCGVWTSSAPTPPTRPRPTRNAAPPSRKPSSGSRRSPTCARPCRSASTAS